MRDSGTDFHMTIFDECMKECIERDWGSGFLVFCISALVTAVL